MPKTILKYALLTVWLLIVGSAATPASAQSQVTFGTTLTDSCTITLGTSGTLVVDSSTGTTLTSEGDGTSATFSVVIIGSAPTITFQAPTLPTYPGTWTDASTKSIKYSGTGVSQDWTSSDSSFSETNTANTYTVDGRVENSAGFDAGTYQLRTTVTCS